MGPLEVVIRKRLARMTRLETAFNNRWSRNEIVTLSEVKRYQGWMSKVAQKAYLAFIEWCRSPEYDGAKERELWPSAPSMPNDKADAVALAFAGIPQYRREPAGMAREQFEREAFGDWSGVGEDRR